MDCESFYEDYGYPMKGVKLQKLKDFLSEEQLSYDDGIEFTINFCDSMGKIAATGSLEGNVLKCIAVSDVYQGEGLAAKIVTALISHGIECGHNHMFLFTKPDNINIFSDLGFYLISKTNSAALMENYKNGISEFVKTLKSYDNHDNMINVGAIVLNCNPFTNGHLYLIETAAKQCDLLHLFVVSEDKSIFPANVRFKLVKSGVKHLKNVVVHPTSDYLISSATFPTYFIKDKYAAGDINCQLDLTIFSEYFAKILNITKRFVGTEPYDKVTASYNLQMKKILSERGIDVIEIQRYQENGVAISASEVRKLFAWGNYEKLNELVPKTTYDFLLSEEGQRIAGLIREINKNA
ncbi:MAG: [citrate (pro-3S)-lyase] ligase [Sedimentibacter sp.]|uniref:[citrate (pro-3S)-lyase] ligase n=1 Tax=Sedimentibacter sp. TaxID=1960295 RepID=UPI002980F76C|nr:[citrate (pro-3S)-lyase] ligase [Sedimentibacter sp.]MDW5300115.1 [citrate (pro-3S)-lyase] ligase [Sedimentibacter sp.]